MTRWFAFIEEMKPFLLINLVLIVASEMCSAAITIGMEDTDVYIDLLCLETMTEGRSFKVFKYMVP